MFRLFKSNIIPKIHDSLPGRENAIPTAEKHFVNGRPLKGPFPQSCEHIIIGMGCFWGVERLYWNLDGVWVTSVGYAAGFTPNPTYQEVCTGQTGHNEVVRITFDPSIISCSKLLKIFWENHDPTQGMRQGNDVGTQYRSGVYVSNPEQRKIADTSKSDYEAILKANRMGSITTEILDTPPYYFAEEYHQQYLAKNVNGYCGLRGTGFQCSLD